MQSLWWIFYDPEVHRKVLDFPDMSCSFHSRCRFFKAFLQFHLHMLDLLDLGGEFHLKTLDVFEQECASMQEGQAARQGSDTDQPDTPAITQVVRWDFFV